MTPNRMYFLKDHFFTTMGELVKFYAERDVPNKELIPNVRLTNAILQQGMQPQANVYDVGLELRRQQQQLAWSSRDNNQSGIYLHMVI